MDPAKRITAAEALSHPWFSESPPPKIQELMPTFPSKAAGEKKRTIVSPQAPQRGNAPDLERSDLILNSGYDEQGGGFQLRL